MTDDKEDTPLKDTLNLPQTNFPMKAGLPQQEPERLQQWQKLNLYQCIKAKNQGRPKFILHDGPPYANGEIHLGHAINKILKDIIVKTKLLSGYDVPFVPGWDCHGLPIELKVENKKGKPGQKLSVNAFRHECRQYAQKQVDKQKADFVRLGILADWEHPYLTMDFANEANIIRAFGKVMANHHVQKGHKPVHWCFDCGSALAEAEVEYADKLSHAIDVHFRVADQEDFFARFKANTHQVKSPDASIVIWTTTPWTLLANQAVAVHPDFTYVLIDCTLQGELQGKQKQILLAKDLLESNLQHYGIETYRIIGECKGKQLEHCALVHPFTDKGSLVVLSNHVTTDAGTGAVHIAPDHGVDDYHVGQKYGLPVLNLVSDRGVYQPHAPAFIGQHVFKANEQIIEHLQQKGDLVKHKTFEHSYPHCWRHKTPIIFRATQQWFISMQQNGLLNKALQTIDQVNWQPEWGYTRIKSMLTNRPDWCISRQRTWGVPVPLFVHKQTGELHPDTSALVEKVATLVEKQGIEAWFDLSVETMLPKAQAAHYDKVKDTLDVWFDSGVTHYSVLEQNSDLHFPADLYLEGSDQHRGWFQSSLLTALAIDNSGAPYKQVLTHGFVVDENGKKMSKSLGNTISPQFVIKQFGADILRLWVSATDFTQEIVLSKEILKRTTDTYRRVRNTARFLLANLHDFDYALDKVDHSELLSLDAWIIHEARQLQHSLIEDYTNYKFAAVYQKIHLFCSRELGGFYLDIIKDRQYTLPKNARTRRSAQTAIYHCLQALVRWIAPILTFTAEEIWEYSGTSDSVLLEAWYTELTPLPKDAYLNAEDWQKIIQIREIVNKQLEQVRKQHLIGSPLNAEVGLYVDQDTYDLLSRLGNELRFVLLTSQAEVHLLQDLAPEETETIIATENKNIRLTIKASKAKKCQRCWHMTEDVDSDPKHPGICKRCVINITATEGEGRLYA